VKVIVESFVPFSVFKLKVRVPVSEDRFPQCLVYSMSIQREHVSVGTGFGRLHLFPSIKTAVHLGNVTESNRFKPQ